MQLIDAFILAFNVLVTSLSAVLLKYAAGIQVPLRRIFLTLFALGIYFLMSFVTIFLYSRNSLIVVQAGVSTTYLVSPILAYFIIKEKLSPKVWISLVAIVIGILCVIVGDSMLNG